MLWYRSWMGDNGVLQRIEDWPNKSIRDVDGRRPFTWHCLHRSHLWVLIKPLNFVEITHSTWQTVALSVLSFKATLTRDNAVKIDYRQEMEAKQ